MSDSGVTSGNLSFPKHIRLLKRPEYLKVMSGERKSVRRSVVCYALENPDISCSRVGITASRKIGKANLRNKAKRRIRETFRSLQHDLKPGFDIVINTRFAINTASYQKIRRDIIACLTDLELFSTTPPSGNT